MKMTKSEIEKLLATMNKFEATEVELDINTDCFPNKDYIDFDIWEFGHFFITALTIEE